MAHALSQIALDAPPEVHAALRGLGRTEDVRLSPGGRRLAIACYGKHGIAVGDVALGRTQSGPTAALTRLEHVSSPALREPHGLDWRDDETLVVANRGGGVAIVRLDGPGPVPAVTLLDVSLDAPGSVALRPLGGGRHEVLVCENWRNAVVRLELDEHGDLRETGPVQEAWLDLPDGLALSRDGRWLAVSNHNSHSVLVFDREAGEDRDPVAVLRGVDYPHGLRFAADGTLLLVADAGAPHVHVFVGAGGWRGGAYAAAVVAVMDEATFLRGRHNPQEGGPKGIDVDTGAQVLLATCEELGLAFFDATVLLERPDRIGVDPDALLRHELDALGAVARERGETERVRAELAAVFATKAWRLTAPLRRLHGRLRRVTGGGGPAGDERPATGTTVPS